ncbi:MAG: hypothetical protein PHR90_00970 [Sphaerochaetaceae bacterium]|nr:hypothetical protein [Sphaerochaetaceae bacterium]MDD3941030.1 hypothetical protein [Sphaerochaetaceae bacterium]
MRIKEELEALRIPSPTGKRRWPDMTIGDILSDEKHVADSVLGRTVVAEYPAIKMGRNSPDEVKRADNHHITLPSSTRRASTLFRK